MKYKLSIIGGLLAIITSFSSCLKETGNYTCPNNSRTHLTMDIDGKTISPDDYATGAVVYVHLGDSAITTMVEMALYNDKTPYSLMIQMDTTVFEGYTFSKDSVLTSYLSINGEKNPIVIDEIKFTQLDGSVPSNFSNLFFYDNGRGSFKGKILLNGSQDSSTITGTFCYDESIEKKK